MYYGQNETFLGIDAETLYYIESNLDNTVFYYIDAAGEIQVAPIPPDPNLFRIILSIAQIAIGGILIATGVGAGFGAMLVLSGIIGLISKFFMEEIGIIFGGLGTIGNGLKCLMVGLQIITCWPVGTILGAAMVVVGGATMLMGANDVILGLTGRNLIQEITGISDKAYMWLNIGLNVASALLTIAASIANAKGMLCFVAGTGVLTVGAGGVIVRKAIENVKIGDRVVTYNEATGMTEIKTVTQTFTSSQTELIKVTDSSGQVITSSLGHPYYTQRGWVAAENLRAGDILQNVNGKAVIVEYIQHELLESPKMLFNFSVDGNQNYYVAESVGISVDEFVLAHNSCKNSNMILIAKRKLGSLVKMPWGITIRQLIYLEGIMRNGSLLTV